MGKSYSKQEEVIIAQNGANSASQTTVEQKLEYYGTHNANIFMYHGDNRHLCNV